MTGKGLFNHTGQGQVPVTKHVLSLDNECFTTLIILCFNSMTEPV